MTEKPKPQSFGWPFWLSLACCIVIFCGFAYTFNKSRGNQAIMTEAVSNLRQIGLALHEFEKQYGAYPNDETAKLIKKKHPSAAKLYGTSSNVLFRQLFAAGVVDNEAMFYARFPGVAKPDNDTSPSHLLEKGEVAFAYVAGLSTKDNPALPVAFGPVIPGTKKIDRKRFHGKGIVLRIDNSVSTFPIPEEGQGIFSPTNPIWDGKAPDIRYPEL